MVNFTGQFGSDPNEIVCMGSSSQKTEPEIQVPSLEVTRIKSSSQPINLIFSSQEIQANHIQGSFFVWVGIRNVIGQNLVSPVYVCVGTEKHLFFFHWSTSSLNMHSWCKSQEQPSEVGMATGIPYHGITLYLRPCDKKFSRGDPRERLRRTFLPHPVSRGINLQRRSLYPFKL